MGKLRDALLREAAEDSRKQLAEIVGPTTDNQMAGSGSAFSRACQESGADLARREFARAKAELENNSNCLATEIGRTEFRQAYRAVPAGWLDDLIREHRA